MDYWLQGIRVYFCEVVPVEAAQESDTDYIVLSSVYATDRFFEQAAFWFLSACHLLGGILVLCRKAVARWVLMVWAFLKVVLCCWALVLTLPSTIGFFADVGWTDLSSSY
ncbi:MAG: hypothetical protein AAF226_08010, partial [Verrucomicrobiota bacterium]